MGGNRFERLKILFLVGIIIAVVLIAGVHFMNQSEEVRIEEQNEAIRQVIPEIDDRDMEYLMSRNVCAIYGRVQKNQDLKAILNSASEEFEEKDLSHPDGPIFGHGVNDLDCIEIYLHEEFPVTRATTDEIYQVVESHASPTETNNTPVIFIRGGLIHLDNT